MGLADYYVAVKSAAFYAVKASRKQTLESNLHCRAMGMGDRGDE